jgi:hypothetical protein
MRFIISLVFLLAIYTSVTGQRISNADSLAIMNKKFDDWNKGWRIKETTKWYSETANNGIVIQNSFPKGGADTDPRGKNFAYRIFFSRVINETGTPLELTINFPADSFAIPPAPDAYLKVFLPPDTMSLNKELLYNYGLDLKSYLDNGPNTPTQLQRTINPNEECLFYVGVLFYQADGVVRAEFVAKEQELFYRITPQLGSELIPCGQIGFK